MKLIPIINSISKDQFPNIFAVRSFLSLGILILMINSCETDVEIPIEYTEPKIVLNAFFGPDDSAKVWLTASKYIYDNSNLKTIEDAQLSVTDIDGNEFPLSHLSDGWYYNDAWVPEAGNEYTIVANHPNYETASAKSIVPESVSFSSLAFGDWLTINEDGWTERMRKISVRFQDPPGKDFYLLRFTNYSYWIYYDYNSFETGDTIWEEYPVDVRVQNNEGGLNSYTYRNTFPFTDVLFNGSEYLFEGYLNEYLFCSYGAEESSKYLKVSLYKIPEDYFYYYTSLENYQTSGDLFFMSQPVQVYTNVNNGLGIFAGYTSNIDSLLIVKEDCNY